MPSKTSIPHSWSLNSWPESVYPNTPETARYLVRANRDALVRESALVRVGRELVITGDRYTRWLARKAGNVAGFECPANREKGQGAAA